MVCQLAATVSAEVVVIGSKPLVPSSYEIAARMVGPFTLVASLVRWAGLVPQAERVPAKAAAAPIAPASLKRPRREVIGATFVILKLLCSHTTSDV